MKNLKFTLAAFILLFTLQTNAQFSINLSLGSRVPYRNHNHDRNNVAYYYLPEIEAYYDINSDVFIYNGPRGWIRSSYLPDYCRNYDVNRGSKIAINYRGNSPYANFDSDRERYYRNDTRNYREEYNRGRNERKNDYVAISNQSRYPTNDNNRNNYRSERSYANNRENRPENHGDRD